MHIEYAQVITQVISFLLTLWLLSKYAWKPIADTLEARKKSIANALEKNAAENERLQQKIDEYDAKMQAADKDMQEKMLKTIAEAKAEGEKAKELARVQARGILIKAQADMEKGIEKARMELKKDLIDMVLIATQKILPKNLDKDTENILIEQIGKHVEEH